MADINVSVTCPVCGLQLDGDRADDNPLQAIAPPHWHRQTLSSCPGAGQRVDVTPAPLDPMTDQEI